MKQLGLIIKNEIEQARPTACVDVARQVRGGGTQRRQGKAGRWPRQCKAGGGAGGARVVVELPPSEEEVMGEHSGGW